MTAYLYVDEKNPVEGAVRLTRVRSTQEVISGAWRVHLEGAEKRGRDAGRRVDVMVVAYGILF